MDLYILLKSSVRYIKSRRGGVEQNVEYSSICVCVCECVCQWVHIYPPYVLKDTEVSNSGRY